MFVEGGACAIAQWHNGQSKSTGEEPYFEWKKKTRTIWSTVQKHQRTFHYYVQGQTTRLSWRTSADNN